MAKQALKISAKVDVKATEIPAKRRALLQKRAEFLDSLMIQQGITIGDLTSDKKLSRKTINRILKADPRHETSPTTWRLLSERLGVSLEALKKGSNKKSLFELVVPVHKPEVDYLFSPLPDGLWEHHHTELGDVVLLGGDDCKTSFAIISALSWVKLNRAASTPGICLFVSTNLTTKELNKRVLAAETSVHVSGVDGPELWEDADSAELREKFSGTIRELSSKIYFVHDASIRFADLAKLIRQFSLQHSDKRILVIVDTISSFGRNFDYAKLRSKGPNCVFYGVLDVPAYAEVQAEAELHRGSVNLAIYLKHRREYSDSEVYESVVLANKRGEVKAYTLYPLYNFDRESFRLSPRESGAAPELPDIEF